MVHCVSIPRSQGCNPDNAHLCRNQRRWIEGRVDIQSKENIEGDRKSGRVETVLKSVEEEKRDTARLSVNIFDIVAVFPRGLVLKKLAAER